jgi:hypothetical protein
LLNLWGKERIVNSYYRATCNLCPDELMHEFMPEG